MGAPHPDHKPPIIITPEELLGWGAWMEGFTYDLSAAFNHAATTGEFEITNPQSQVPQANQGIPSQRGHHAKNRTPRKKKPSQ